MARMKIPAEELRKRRRARELKRKMSSNSKPVSDGANKGDDVCAICDNGGSLTCCDGGCKRSFHLDDSEGSTCRLALGLTKDQAKTIIDTEQDFVCKNCKFKQHQCFACGLLGYSDPSSSTEPEVFQCEHDDCGRFYHRKCVAKLLYSDGEDEATLFEHQVAAGLGFPCPVHECSICRKGEDKEDEDMQFAVCRRCPTTYHRKCLPKEILFKTKKGPNGSMRRAWEGVLPDRVLIYCMKHDIARKLKTPTRDHVVFPDAEKLRATAVPRYSPMEKRDVAEEDEQHRHSYSEPSPSPPLPASNKKQCLCSGHMDSFAPKSLFMHPQPGSCGWIDDD